MIPLGAIEVLKRSEKMRYETLYVTADGLRLLLADLASCSQSNEIPSPIRVYPAPRTDQVKVELTEYEYTRLLNKDLRVRYNTMSKGVL
jgi:hypothetical protein